MTAPRRRWFRFSLRSLFVVVTVLAIPLGWIGWNYHLVRQRNAVIRLVESAGGRAGYSNCFPPKTWSTVFLGDTYTTAFLLPPSVSADIRRRISESFPGAEIIFISGQKDLSTNSSAASADQP